MPVVTKEGSIFSIVATVPVFAYHDLVTDMLARAIHSVGNEHADEIAAYEEERRMRRSYYEKVENRANGGASDDGEESDH